MSLAANFEEVARSSRRGLTRNGGGGLASADPLTPAIPDVERGPEPELGAAAPYDGGIEEPRALSRRSRLLNPVLAAASVRRPQTSIPGTPVTPFAFLRHSDRPSEQGTGDNRSTNAAPPLDDVGVSAAKQGDPSSWEAAYLAYGRALMGYLMVRLDNRDDAAEALSETFTRAIDKAGAFRGDACAFRAWLFSIALNVSTDQFRHRSRLVVRPDQFEADDRVQPSGEDLAISHEDVAELRRGFARLPKADQEVLWLRICSGLSAAEAGEVLGKKAGAVRMQQLRALGALRGQVRL
jgi:RNA polymerase sigma-70 factor, ECF subfamily